MKTQKKRKLADENRLAAGLSTKVLTPAQKKRKCDELTQNIVNTQNKFNALVEELDNVNEDSLRIVHTIGCDD